MAKMIKFDLLLNGNKVKSLEELEDNFTFEVIAIARSGRLLKWLLSRDETELAEKVKAIETVSEDLELFKALATIFEIEYDEKSIQELYDEFLAMKEEMVTKIVDKSSIDDVPTETEIPDIKNKNNHRQYAKQLLDEIDIHEQGITAFWNQMRNTDSNTKIPIKEIGEIVQISDNIVDKIKTADYSKVQQSLKDFKNKWISLKAGGHFFESAFNDFEKHIHSLENISNELEKSNYVIVESMIDIDELLIFITEKAVENDTSIYEFYSMHWLLKQLQAYYEEQGESFEIRDNYIITILQGCELYRTHLKNAL